MVKFPIAGQSAYVLWKSESTFGGGAVTDKAFGWGHTVTLARKSNIQRVYGLGNRSATNLVETKYDGTMTIDWVLGSSYFLRNVLGKVTDGGATPFTHTYTEQDIIPSLAIEVGFDLDTDSVQKFVGAKINTCSVTATAGELVKVRAEIVYQTETESSAALGSQAIDTNEPFVFSQATFELPTGNVISDVRTAEISMGNTLEPIFGIGSRFLGRTAEKNREYSIKLEVPFEDVADILDVFYGATGGPQATIPETATAKLVITNGGIGSLMRKLEFDFTGLKIDDESVGITPTEVIYQTVTLFARSLTIIASDNTTTAPT